MRWSAALEYIILGRDVTMRRWPKGQYIKMFKVEQKPGQLPKQLPMIVMRTPLQELFPWTPGQAETFAVDFEVVDDES